MFFRDFIYTQTPWDAPCITSDQDSICHAGGLKETSPRLVGERSVLPLGNGRQQFGSFGHRRDWLEQKLKGRSHDIALKEQGEGQQGKCRPVTLQGWAERNRESKGSGKYWLLKPGRQSGD